MQILKDKMRSNILKAAEGEFLKHGKTGSSMRAIAAQTGCTVGNLYRYYPSKEAMYKAVMKKTAGTRNGDLLKVCELVSQKGIVWMLKKLPADELKRLAGGK